MKVSKKTCVYISGYLPELHIGSDDFFELMPGSSSIYGTPQAHCTKQAADDPTFSQLNNANSRV
jgi:hypothetical protein